MFRFVPVAFLAIFLICDAPAAIAQVSQQQKKFEPFLTRSDTTLSLSIGARTTDTEWSVAGNGGPNVLAEQTWTDVKTVELQGGVRHQEPLDILIVRGDVHLEADVTLGLSVDGKSRNSSYLLDNRTLEDTRQTFGSIDGDSIGGGAAVGYRIHLTGTPGWKARNIVRARTPESVYARRLRAQQFERALRESGPHISVTPLVGYAIQQQTFHREDAFNHVALGPPINLPRGPFNTESDYIANWYGPYLGLEGEIRNQKHMLRLRGEIHDLTYYGKGIEPSREDLKQDPTYEHDADADGLVIKGEYAYALGDTTALTFSGEYRERTTDGAGEYNAYPVNGPAINRVLNETSDTSEAVRIGLRYLWN